MKKTILLLLAVLMTVFAYGYAAATENPEIFVQMGHTGSVDSVAFSPDGRYALSGGGDNKMNLWEVVTGRQIRSFTGYASEVKSVVFSPDGKFALSGDSDGLLKLWEIATGREIRVFNDRRKDFYVTSVAFSPDGRLALSGSGDKSIKLWEVATGKQIRSLVGDAGVVTSIAFSPDGRFALSGSEDKTLKLWDVATGKKLKIFNGHKDKVNSVAFSADGRFALSGSEDKTLKLWDIATGKQIRSFSGHSGGVDSIAFSPDGRYALSGGSSDPLKLWDIATGKEIRTFDNASLVKSVAFSPDGKYALSGSMDTTLKLWDIETGKEIRTFAGQVSRVETAAFSPDGKHILSGGMQMPLKLWDIATGNELREFKGDWHSSDVRSVAFSPDGKYALAGGGYAILLWEVATGKEMKRFGGEGSEANSVAFSPDGRFGLSGEGTDTVKLWDIATGRELRTFKGSTGQGVSSVAFSPDGKRALSASDDLNLWDIATGKKISTFEKGMGFFAAAFSPDGRYALAAGYDLRLWEVVTGKEIKTFDTGNINSVAFSPDGRYVLSGAGYETLKLWDISSGKKVKSFQGHTGVVKSVEFSPDGKYILSGSWDGTTRLWDINTGKEIAQFISFSDGEWVVFTPEGYYSASANGDKHLNVRIGNKVYGVDQYREKFFRPEVVAAALAGKPTADHASQKTAPDVAIVETPTAGGGGEVKVKVKVADAAKKTEIFVQMGHTKRINAVVFSADGKYAMSGSWDNTLKLWDVASGREVRTFYGKAKVSAIAISPDGKFAISGDEDHRKNLKLWDMATGKMIRAFSGHEGGMEAVTSVAFTPDGKQAVSAGGHDQTLKLWDVESGEELRTYNDDNKDHAKITSIAISPDGKLVIVGSRYNGQVEMPDGSYANAKSTDNTIGVWDISTGEKIKAFNGGKGWVQALALTPDGKYVVSGDFEDSAKMWDIAAGKQIKTFDAQSISSISLSPDGKYALFGGNESIRLWDVGNNREIRKLSGHDGWIHSVAFSPDGKYVLSGSDDSSPKLWDIASGAVIWSFGGYTRQVASVSVGADGKKLLVGQEAGLLNLWDTSNGRQLKTIKHTLGVNAALISPDGTLAAAGGWDYKQGASTVKLWNIASGAEIQTLIKAGEGQWSRPLAISPDNKSILWSVGSALMLSDIASGKKIKTYPGHKSDIKSAMMSADGRYAISAGIFLVSVWDVASGKAIKTFLDKEGRGQNGTLSSDGKNVLLVNYDNQDQPSLRIWDLPKNREIRKMAVQYGPNTPTGWIESLTLSHDGRFALWSENMTLYLCDIARGEVLKTFSGHENKISSISISPDDKYAYSASYDGTTRVWDIATGKEVAQFIGFTDGEWIAMTPEGYYTGSDKADQYVNVRIGNRVFGIDQYREKFFRPEVVMAALAGKPIADLASLTSVKPAPSVSIVETPATVKSDDATVRVKVADAGGGIGDVRLYLNGSAVVLDRSRNLAVAETRNEAQVFSYKVRLVAGKNSLRAVAFNAGNSMQSTDALHVIEASFAAKKPSLYALVIGIQEYDNPKLTLKYPVGDAKLMAATLKEQATGLFENVNVVELTSKAQTSKDAITQALQEMSAKVSPDDLFVFFVASHGTVDDGEYFLITSNVGATSSHILKRTAFSQDDLKTLIANVPSTKKLVLIDTCNAGKLGEAIQMAMLTRGMDEDTALKILSRAVGSTILSASNSVQEALEGYKDHGLFTYVVAAGLKGAADSDKDGYVKTYELVDYVDSQVPELAEKVFNHKQYPTTTLSGQGFPVVRVK